MTNTTDLKTTILVLLVMGVLSYFLIQFAVSYRTARLLEKQHYEYAKQQEEKERQNIRKLQRRYDRAEKKQKELQRSLLILSKQASSIENDLQLLKENN